MYLAFALDHIPRRMSELGFGNNYLTRYRQIYSDPAKKVRIDADNQYWYLIEPDAIKVESQRGVFDLSDTAINMQQHEHSGKIIVTNNTGGYKWVLFIQVIPQHIKAIKP